MPAIDDLRIARREMDGDPFIFNAIIDGTRGVPSRPSG